MPPTITSPADRRRAARVSAGLTVAELARRLGVTPQRVCNLESGKCNATLTMVARIAEAIGCDPHALDPMLASRPPRLDAEPPSRP
jgi:transcriptional regulator with XRE-family HTH domain